MRSHTVSAYGNSLTELEADAVAQAAVALSGLHYEVKPNYEVYDLTAQRSVGAYISPGNRSEGTRRGKRLFATITLSEVSPGTPGLRSSSLALAFTCSRCNQDVPVGYHHYCSDTSTTTSPK